MSSSCELRRRATRRIAASARQCIGRLPRGRGIGRSPTRCSSPTTQRWNWNVCRPNARWSRRDSGIQNSEFRILNYKKSLIVLVVLHPIPRVLVEKRQRLERLHSIEEQNTVQVIG